MEMNPSSSELPGFTVTPDVIGRLAPHLTVTPDLIGRLAPHFIVMPDLIGHLLLSQEDCRSGPAMTWRVGPAMTWRAGRQ